MIIALNTPCAARRHDVAQTGFRQQRVDGFPVVSTQRVISVLNALQHENAIGHDHDRYCLPAPLKGACANAAAQAFAADNFFWRGLIVSQPFI